MDYTLEDVRRHFTGMGTADWNRFIANLQKLGFKSYTRKEFQELLLREQGGEILKDMLNEQ